MVANLVNDAICEQPFLARRQWPNLSKFGLDLFHYYSSTVDVNNVHNWLSPYDNIASKYEAAL